MNAEIPSWLDNTWTMHRYDLENESWKLEWIILRWWATENQSEKSLELLRMDEKNSHNRKQLWEDGIKLEPWILKRMDQDLEEKLFFGLQNPIMTTKNTTMNCWDTPGERKTKRLSQHCKIIWNRSWKTSDWWNSFLRQTLKRIWNSSGIIRRVK